MNFLCYLYNHIKNKLIFGFSKCFFIEFNFCCPLNPPKGDFGTILIEAHHRGVVGVPFHPELRGEMPPHFARVFAGLVGRAEEWNRRT